MAYRLSRLRIKIQMANETNKRRLAALRASVDMLNRAEEAVANGQWSGYLPVWAAHDPDVIDHIIPTKRG